MPQMNFEKKKNATDEIWEEEECHGCTDEF
jgi:hypothetical protein